MAAHKKADLFNTAPECRAKAASLRTVSVHAHNPVSKAKILAMALDWDARADAFDAKR